ncbi:hypothetical protein [Bacillus sp. 1P06AnD]|uniref:hypothetical protein n=1 Tax=Bacillus sp. 1P06AnD TaxID=3132208 RepID=UPI0039A1FA27
MTKYSILSYYSSLLSNVLKDSTLSLSEKNELAQSFIENIVGFPHLDEEITSQDAKNLVQSVIEETGFDCNLLTLSFEEMDETIITCSMCGKNYEEEDVNIIDYDLDLCIHCEKEHLKQNSL